MKSYLFITIFPMGSKTQKNVVHTWAGEVVLHEGIRMAQKAEWDNLLQYKQTQPVDSFRLMRALTLWSEEDDKCRITLDFATWKLFMVDMIDSRTQYNKMFFDKVGKGIQIGEYKDGKFSSELEQFLKDNPEYTNDPIIKHLANCIDKEKQS
jgi:hypothetical protein